MTSPHLLRPTPRSAAHDAYMIAEIRQQILLALQRKDLVSFLRVEKGCLADVARVLYRKVPQSQVFNLDPSIERHQVYLGAVTSVAFDQSLAPIHNEEGSPEHAADIMVYRAELYEVFVPPLRRRCPSLRRIVFDRLGAKPGTSWSVDFERSLPSSPSAAPATDRELLDGGHIVVVKTFRERLHAPVPESFKFETSPLPSAQCTISMRFNLELYRHRFQHYPDHTGDWMSTLTNNRAFADLFKAVDFGDLEVGFPLITSLYERQIAAGHCDRLEHISARGIVSWTIAEFHTFARLASHSLSSLELGQYPSEHLSFSDTPQLLHIIRQSLSNLHKLRIPLQVTEHAEAECRTWLSEQTLEPRGSITQLQIQIPRTPSPPYFFNTLRCLAPLLADGGYVGFWTAHRVEAKGTEFLGYLRSQPQHRRVHLSTVDFPSLGILDLPSVLGLTYHDDGRPRRRLETEATRWMETTFAVSAAPEVLLSSISATLEDTATACQRLQECTISANDEQTLEAMRRFLEAAEESEKVGVDLAKMVAERNEKAARMKEEIKRSIGLMEAAAVASRSGD